MDIWSQSKTYLVRNTTVEDYEQIKALCMSVYPVAAPWTFEQIYSHCQVFPEGQFVAIQKTTGAVVGMASSLVIRWDDYEFDQSWTDFTDRGLFTNHDIENGKTLYGAEVMTSPKYRGQRVGSLLYEARRALVLKLDLHRIRAGARMRGYATYAEQYSPKEYAARVAEMKLFDPTISFQLKQGFKIVGVVANYLRSDPESLGNAAIIEWRPPLK